MYGVIFVNKHKKMNIANHENITVSLMKQKQNGKK